MHTLATLLIVAAAGLPVAAATDVPGAPAAAAGPELNGGPRVRPYDGRSAAFLLEGLRRSATMRTIVDQLEERDLIVYIRMQPSLGRRWAGSLTWVAGTARFRYVQIALNPQLRGVSAIAALGHELHHALEVANEPSIVSPATLNDHYRRHGIMMTAHSNGWDTEAARVAGDDVLREVATTSAALETIQDFDPAQWFEIYRRARRR